MGTGDTSSLSPWCSQQDMGTWSHCPQPWCPSLVAVSPPGCHPRWLRPQSPGTAVAVLKPPLVTTRCHPRVAGDHSLCPVSPPVPTGDNKLLPPSCVWPVIVPSQGTPGGHSHPVRTTLLSPHAVTSQCRVTRRVYCVGVASCPHHRSVPGCPSVSPGVPQCPQVSLGVPRCHSVSPWRRRIRCWRCFRRRSRSNSFMRIT